MAPFALVVSPALYAGLNRIHDGTGVLELEQVRKIATAGVYQTPVLGNNVESPSRWVPRIWISRSRRI